MNAGNTTEKAGRRDLFSVIGVLVFAAAFLLYYVVSIAVRQEFDTPLGHAVGGVSIAELNTAQVVLYSIGIGLKVLCLFGMIGVLTAAARNMLRGQFFTVANVRFFTAACFLLLAASFGWFVEGMGDNWYAAQIGMENWPGPGPSVPSFVLWYVLLLTLSLVAVAVRRGVRMQEDVDGLV